MKIVLHGERELELRDFLGQEIQIEVAHPDAHYGALQMFITALGVCTYSVLAEYGRRIDAPAEAIAMRLRWRYAEEPVRIDDIDMEIRWPGLPESRLEAAQRAAAHCAIHNTLAQPPSVNTRVGP